MNLITLDSLPQNLRRAIVLQELIAGQRLFQQGDTASTFFMIETGRFRMIRNTIEDTIVTLQFAEAGEILAEAALFSDIYYCTAIAEVDSRIIGYPVESLLSALREYPDLAEYMMARIVRKIQAFQVRLELRNIRTAHKRVLQYLRYLVEASENVVTFNQPMKDIATDLGFTPETLSRALARLEREGAITRSGRSITIHDSSAA